jgi:hypothetical protein
MYHTNRQNHVAHEEYGQSLCANTSSADIGIVKIGLIGQVGEQGRGPSGHGSRIQLLCPREKRQRCGGTRQLFDTLKSFLYATYHFSTQGGGRLNFHQTMLPSRRGANPPPRNYNGFLK